MKHKKDKVWIEINSIPKNFEPQDTLIIPDHKFIKKEAWIEYELKRKRKMK